MIRSVPAEARKTRRFSRLRICRLLPWGLRGRANSLGHSSRRAWSELLMDFWFHLHRRFLAPPRRATAVDTVRAPCPCLPRRARRTLWGLIIQGGNFVKVNSCMTFPVIIFHVYFFNSKWEKIILWIISMKLRKTKSQWSKFQMNYCKPVVFVSWV